MASPSPEYCDTASQTEWTGGWEPCYLTCDQKGMLQSSNQMQLVDCDVGAEDEVEESCDVEYEEILLKRTCYNERLGLTLCYRNPEDAETDIFISEIEDSGIAGKDGRLQEGDQLLQINGIEVYSRDQAINLFSEKRTDFTLVVARSNTQAEDIPSVYIHEDGRASRVDERFRYANIPENFHKCASTSTSSLVDAPSTNTHNDTDALTQGIDTLQIRSPDSPTLSERTCYVTGSSQKTLTDLNHEINGGNKRSTDNFRIRQVEEWVMNIREERFRKSDKRCTEYTVDKSTQLPTTDCSSPYPSTTMYTNPAHLEHTMWIQQQLLRQSLAKQTWKTCVPMSSRMPDHATASPEYQVEWKVKKRSDGSRYITRRPVRNRLLKERALQIMEERCGQTTDDDVMSELKTGKYWTKEERKRHLEKSRERKKRAVMMRTKMNSVREEQEEQEVSPHRKNKKSPVQYLVPSGRKQFGLLSVTTV
ncbi:E3 ubiquitin-protein ligase PDZRN3-like [Centruroides sculpturatus]|uniref:E3 ubiquitin-protein ligase PDZRN3-like n=1 Tax=Centruroides sculpturatus TaxID=218467 RepID=UPI000C6C8C03|nr:E3 ubiquitin-protein ligase PDZRN3-like [Centruroides sculpturatus]